MERGGVRLPAEGERGYLLVDVDGVVRELRARGKEIEDGRVVGPDRQIVIDDPDGNAIELHQLGTATSLTGQHDRELTQDQDAE